MSFLEEKHMDFLNYLFMTRTLMYGSTVRPIVEAGPQVLMLRDVTLRPLSPSKCIYTFEFIKEDPIIKYVPIFKKYEVTIIQGKCNDDGVRMSNMLSMAYGLPINFKKESFIEVFTHVTKLKKKSFNAVIAFKRELIVNKGNISIDDSYLAMKAQGPTTFKSLFSSFIVNIKTIEQPILSTDYDVTSLIMEHSEKDQFLINKFQSQCLK